MKPDFGLLLLRLTFGLLMMGHGLGKVQDLIAGKTAFADPIGIGQGPSLALAAFAEFFCALAVVVGFKTRWAAIPIVVTMLVAAFIVHADDGWGQAGVPAALRLRLPHSGLHRRRPALARRLDEQAATATRELAF